MDCCFVDGNKRFRYRACAIIIEDNEVLFAKNALDDYYYSIGGAVEVGETLEDAVKRESWLVLTKIVYNINMLLLDVLGIPVPEKM